MAGKELSEEEIANMSPEEISELQKQSCIFCHMISGKIPVKRVFEDDKCIAILDINPAAKGHLLLFPKEHHVVLQMLPEDTIKHLGRIVKHLSKTMIRSLGAEGTTTFIASGAIAGQKAPHALIHIIPRNEKDNITCFDIPEKSISEKDLINVQKLFAQKFGTKIEPVKRGETEVEEESTNEENIVKQTKQENNIEKEKHNKIEKSEIKISKTNNISKDTSKKQYITSEKAKRFHAPSCPFGDKIPKENRIYLTEEEALKERQPCECTGLTKKQLKKVGLGELEDILK